MKLDLTVTISVILGLSAIVSPIAVALINNIYNLKLKKYENYDIKKFEALETFSKFVGTHIYLGSGYSAKDYVNSLYGLLPFFDISNEELEVLVNSVDNRNVLLDENNKLIKRLSKTVKPYK